MKQPVLDTQIKHAIICSSSIICFAGGWREKKEKEESFRAGKSW